MRFLVMIGAVIGALCLLASFFVGGAPQQAALAGMACAFAIIPYVGFRASQLTDEENERRKFRADLMELLKPRQPSE
ncbi:MAG: hypothetical protein KKB08_06720 [Gammaproteobacteria bacterium]|nr:hypothetical protein [Gammaproteobacteria bacterium]